MTFNHRQIELLSHALRHNSADYTIKGYEKTNAVVYQTARTDLFDLVQKGLLVQRKQGSYFVFRPADNLETLLKVKKEP
jgi:Fic family protein